MMSGVHRFTAQEQVVFGTPVAEALLAEADRLGCSRLFVVASPSMRGSPLIAGISGALGPLMVGAYFDMGPHSPRDSVVGAANAARAAGADLLVAIGGGSVIDACKVAQRCLWQGLTRAEEIDGLPKGHLGNALPEMPEQAGKLVRLVAVPTTFSGAEFTAFAGITNSLNGVKELIDHPLQIPRTVILDPEATIGVPAWVLLSTGVRAVDHCVETFCSPGAQPYADGMAVQALGMLLSTLPKLRDDPQNRDLLLDAQLGMWLSVLGPAAGVPIGASHGIGRVLGGAFGVPHGRTSCMLLPAVLRWNAEVNRDRQAALAAAIGRPERALADTVCDLIESLGEPVRLRESGLTEADLPSLAERAVASGFVAHNPRPIPDAGVALELLRSAW